MLFMLAWVSVTLCMFSALGYFVGRNTPAELRFLEPRRAPTMDEAIITYPVEYSLRSQEKNDAIFVGDSTCRSGIDPAEFERLTGLRAYNLGSQGKAGPMAYTLTAMAYLSKHPAPGSSSIAFHRSFLTLATRVTTACGIAFWQIMGPRSQGCFPGPKAFFTSSSAGR